MTIVPSKEQVYAHHEVDDDFVQFTPYQEYLTMSITSHDGHEADLTVSISTARTLFKEVLHLLDTHEDTL